MPFYYLLHLLHTHHTHATTIYATFFVILFVILDLILSEQIIKYNAIWRISPTLPSSIIKVHYLWYNGKRKKNRNEHEARIKWKTYHKTAVKVTISFKLQFNFPSNNFDLFSLHCHYFSLSHCVSVLPYCTVTMVIGSMLSTSVCCWQQQHFMGTSSWSQQLIVASHIPLSHCRTLLVLSLSLGHQPSSLLYQQVGGAFSSE